MKQKNKKNKIGKQYLFRYQHRLSLMRSQSSLLFCTGALAVTARDAE
jgi:hypothetical protein